MPTGYTSKLYDGEQDFKDFVLKAARGMGALISMRDDPMDAEIPTEFEPSSYHLDRHAEAVRELEQIKHRDEGASRRLFLKKLAAYKADRKESEETRLARKARYEDMRSRVSAWVPPTAEHVAFRDFMLNQLEESIKFDCGVYDPGFPTYDEWVVLEQQRCERDITYHLEEHEKEVRRARERTEWVRSLVNSL